MVYLLRTRTDHDQAKREGKVIIIPSPRAYDPLLNPPQSAQKYSKLDSSDSSDEDQEGGVSDNSINFDDFEGTGVSKMSENGGEKIEMGYLENGNMNMAEEEGAGGGPEQGAIVRIFKYKSFSSLLSLHFTSLHYVFKLRL